MNEDEKAIRILEIEARRNMLASANKLATINLTRAQAEVCRAESSIRSINEEDLKLEREYTKLTGW